MDTNRDWVRRLATGMIVAGIVGAVLSVWMLRDQQSRRKIEATFGLQSPDK